MKKQSATLLQKIKAKLNNVLRMQAGLHVHAVSELKTQKQTLRDFEELYEREKVLPHPNKKRLQQLQLHIAMQQEVIAQYQDTLIGMNAKEHEL